MPASCAYRSSELSAARLRPGFALTDLVVAAAVLGMLLALLLPGLRAARERARGSQCRDHLRQLGVALGSYHDTHSSLPAGPLVRSVQRTDMQETSGSGQSEESPRAISPARYVD